MHPFIDDVQDHWPLWLFGIGMAWGLVIWAWGKLVVSPRQLEDCYQRVDREQTEAHGRIELGVKDISKELKEMRQWWLDNWNKE